MKGVVALDHDSRRSAALQKLQKDLRNSRHHMLLRKSRHADGRPRRRHPRSFLRAQCTILERGACRPWQTCAHANVGPAGLSNRKKPIVDKERAERCLAKFPTDWELPFANLVLDAAAAQSSTGSTPAFQN